MAKKGKLERAKKTLKFAIRERKRCQICGNPRGYMGRFGICRKCFRELAHKGELPGVMKASW
jgi:small subunit ribosomal protein S14